MSLTIRACVAALPMMLSSASLAADAPGAPPPQTSVAAFESIWKPVLGDEGPGTADRLIDAMTPGCIDPTGPTVLEARLSPLDLDLLREARSAVTERSIRREGYSIDVARLEVFPGLLLPVNVYVPESAPERSAPVVLTPTGCGSSLWSPHVQRRAANLASLGMVTVVTDGFCRNGPRRALTDSNPNIGYARQLVGMPGDMTIYLQELISTLTWTLSSYPQTDPGRIGVAGYSYGGQMAMLLAVFDDRVTSVSVPATGIGESCDGFALHSDLWAANDGAEFVWSAPLELPVLPTNWRIARLSPRPFHTTAGFLDVGAHPDVIGAAIEYARRIYGAEGRILYRTDPEGHHYGKSRREDTYEWLAHTLLDRPLGPTPEREIELVFQGDLSPDISGTTTLSGDLAVRIDAEIARRSPATSSGGRVTEAVGRLFAGPAATPAPSETVWEAAVDDVRLRADRIDAGAYALPAFVFERERAADNGRLLYLPCEGTRAEIDRIVRLLDHYDTVVSLDYLGIGELESNRLLRHTVARYFMHHDPSLPQMNVAAIRSWMKTSEPVVIHGCGWASSFYAAVLAHLEADRVDGVWLEGAPDDELRYLASGRKVPDLLLQGGLFAELTVAELSTGLGIVGTTEP